MSLPANNSSPVAEAPLIAGSVLPIQRAEDLLSTLPGVISARIVAGASGAVEEIHILTSTEVTAKQTVRNVESALIAHLGMRVSHKKISVATSDEAQRPPRIGPGLVAVRVPAESETRVETDLAPAATSSANSPAANAAVRQACALPAPQRQLRRRIYFEDLEVRRSRSRGVACRVTLRKGDQSYVGDAEGTEHERMRIELAARATLGAIRLVEGEDRPLMLEGCKLVDAFEHQFVFVGVMSQMGRESLLMTGSAEVRDSAETASVLAVLDATNRWMERGG